MTGHPCGSALFGSLHAEGTYLLAGFAAAAFRAFDPFLVVFRYGHLQHELFLARLALVRVGRHGQFLLAGVQPNGFSVS